MTYDQWKTATPPEYSEGDAVAQCQNYSTSHESRCTLDEGHDEDHHFKMPRSPEQRRIADLTTERDALRAELERVKDERDEMRNAILHVCQLQISRRDDEAQMWAIRQTANYLTVPFSYDDVQRRYEELSHAWNPATSGEGSE